jgi:hypothetical protein
LFVVKKIQEKGEDGRPKKIRKQGRKGTAADRESGLTPAQLAVNEQMRRALEEDQYSANGSIVLTDSDNDDHQHMYKGKSLRLDRNFLMQAARKHLWMERVNGGNATGAGPGANADDADSRRGGRKKKKKGKTPKEDDRGNNAPVKTRNDTEAACTIVGNTSATTEKVFERDEGSIFGQTTGSSNSTWVECDKCKKVRVSYALPKVNRWKL